MRIREEAMSRAAPERLWQLIADPSLHGSWNPRVVDTELASAGEPGMGYRYRLTYELSGRKSTFDAEITEFVPGSRFAARLEERNKGDGRHWRRFVEESFTLTRRGARTHVRHDVRIHHSGVPLLVRALIALLSRWGRPQGQTYLERLAELADQPESEIQVTEREKSARGVSGRSIRA